MHKYKARAVGRSICLRMGGFVITGERPAQGSDVSPFVTGGLSLLSILKITKIEGSLS